MFVGAASALHGGEKINIAMGYIPNVQFAPYYIAEEKGYFAHEGLEVTFDYGMSTDIMTLVAEGLVDFGISDGDQVIIARDKGIPVKVVYTMYVKYPVGVVSLKKKGLDTVQKLRGVRVGTPGPYGSNYIGLQVLLRSGGMKLNDIDLNFIEYTQIESLLANRVDAAVVFINNEPIVLKSLGRDVNLIETYRVTPMVSAAVITGEKLIRRKPDTIRKFVQAVIKASTFALQNREQVIPLLQRYIPTLTEENIDINRRVLFASMELWMDQDIEEFGLGYTTPDDWVQSIDVLYSLGMIEKKMTPEECFTNEFLQ
jgi:NitT/TauT family transport system substrate-binding protein